MSKTLCPGQDTAFWSPNDVFEVPCGKCGEEIEFFKDDSKRRCASCGNIVKNPKLNLGCAMWCEHAKDCLGYDPKEAVFENLSPDEALLEKLLLELKNHFGRDVEKRKLLEKTMDNARALLADESANPKAALLASALYGLSREAAEKVLEKAGIDQTETDNVLDILFGEAQNSKEARLAKKAREKAVE